MKKQWYTVVMALPDYLTGEEGFTEALTLAVRASDAWAAGTVAQKQGQREIGLELIDDPDDLYVLVVMVGKPEIVATSADLYVTDATGTEPADTSETDYMEPGELPGLHTDAPVTVTTQGGKVD